MATPNRLPTAAEINVHDSLDERTAVQNFLYRSLDEAEKLFRENFEHYQEDLMFMGPIAFCFYVPSAIRYLLSPDSDGRASAVSAFCMVVEFRLEHDATEITTARPALREGIRAILERYDRYECDESIWGDVAARLRLLLEKLGD